MFEAEITELISKNLPAHVGEVLRRRLESCTALEALIGKKDKAIAELEALVDDYKKKVREDESIRSDRATLDKRILEHDKKERQLAIDRAVLDALAAVNAQRMRDNKDIVLAVFANARYKYEQFEDKALLVPTENGCVHAKQVQERKTIVTEGDGPRG